MRNIVVVKEFAKVDDHEMEADKAALGSGVTYGIVYVVSGNMMSTFATSGFQDDELNNVFTSGPYTTANSRTFCFSRGCQHPTVVGKASVVDDAAIGAARPKTMHKPSARILYVILQSVTLVLK